MLSRRKFLSFSSLAVGACTLSPSSFAKGSVPLQGRDLNLLNLHTGERLQACYWEKGQYQTDAMSALNHFFRDHRNDQISEIDPLLLDSIFNLNQQLGYRGEIHIISGYRSQETNDKLLQQGRKVAKRSLHLQGRAIDLRLPKQDLAAVHRAALELHQGGVGYYARSNFIHLDTGRQRRWG